MEHFIHTEESLNRDTEIVCEALWDAQSKVLMDMLELMENVRSRVGDHPLYDSQSRVAGYQEALLDVMEVVKRRVSMNG